MKKIISIFLIVILMCSCMSFIGCQKEEYYVTIKLECVGSYGHGKEFFELSEENPTAEVTRWNNSIYGIEYGDAFYIKRKSDDAVIEWFFLSAEKGFMPYSLTDNKIEITYQVLNSENEMQRVDFIYKDYILRDAYVKKGKRFLDRNALTHKITYHIPKIEEYGIEEATFEVTLNLEEDTRRAVEVKSYSYKGEAFKFQDYEVYNTSSVITYIQDLETGYGPSSKYRNFYRKLGLTGFEDACHISHFSELTEKGLYWCFVLYEGNSTYKDAVYYFYIVIQ